MFRHILRYCKPQKTELYYRNRKLYTVNIINLKRNAFRNVNLKLTLHTSISPDINTSTITKIGHFHIDHENLYAYNVIKKNSKCADDYRFSTGVLDVKSEKEFNELLDRNWRESSIGDIVNVFSCVKKYCITHNIDVSDRRFDNLVDGLMENCEHISNNELIELLYCLAEMPPVESYATHNFHDIWSCLDDICCWKIIDWDFDTSCVIANAWYKLQLGKLCDYIFIFIDRTVKRADKLNKNQLVNIFFYFNICRKRAVDFEYEFALDRLIKVMDVDQIAVVAMGYFKTKTKIKLIPVQEVLVDKVIENSKTVQDISLTAILKILRFSKTIKIVPKIEEMSELLRYEIDRLSELSCMHLALLSTGIQTYNSNILQAVTEKVVKNITDPKTVRIKDIERILNVLTMFNFNAKTEPDIFKVSYEEIHKKDRLAEAIKYPRCIMYTLNYLSIKNIYSYELLDQILNIEYITDIYGKGAKALPREMFSLDCSVQVECPDYNGSRLPLELRYKAAKFLIEFVPKHDQYKKLSATDNLILDVIDTIISVIGDDKLIHVQHVLPHFSRADIILCKDKKTGKFVEPMGFQNYVLGDVMVPYNDGSLYWFAVVILGWNNTVKDTNIPLGHAIMKERQLRTIGYEPVFAIWGEFQKLPNPMRQEYMRQKLRMK